MRKRTRLLIFTALLAWAGCIDTFEPEGPAPGPPPDDGGELAPLPDFSGEARDGRTSVSPRRPSS
jgi:hypothetical protein